MRVLLTGLVMAAAAMPCACGQRVPEPAQYVPAVTEDRPVRLYPEAERVRLIVQDGGRAADGSALSRKPEGTWLSATQRAALDAAFRQVVTVRPEIVPEGLVMEPAAAVACFIPHHFFEFVSGVRVIGRMSVCFCCGGVLLDPASGAGNQLGPLKENMRALAALVVAMGLPTNVECDHPEPW